MYRPGVNHEVRSDNRSIHPVIVLVPREGSPEAGETTLIILHLDICDRFVPSVLTLETMQQRRPTVRWMMPERPNFLHSVLICHSVSDPCSCQKEIVWALTDGNGSCDVLPINKRTMTVPFREDI